MPTPDEILAMRGAMGGGGGMPGAGGMGANPWIQQLMQRAQQARAMWQQRMQQGMHHGHGAPMGPGGPPMGGPPMGGPPMGMPGQARGFAMGEPNPGGQAMPTAAEQQARTPMQPQGEGPGEVEGDRDGDDKGGGAAPAARPQAAAMPIRQPMAAAAPQQRMPMMGGGASGSIQEEIRKRRAGGRML